MARHAHVLPPSLGTETRAADSRLVTTIQINADWTVMASQYAGEMSYHLSHHTEMASSKPMLEISKQLRTARPELRK